MIKQTPFQQFSSEDNKITIYCANDTSLGSLHDFLMFIKGEIVERMVKSQKEEEAASAAVKMAEVDSPTED